MSFEFVEFHNCVTQTNVKCMNLLDQTFNCNCVDESIYLESAYLNVTYFKFVLANKSKIKNNIPLKNNGFYCKPMCKYIYRKRLIYVSKIF